MPVVVRPVVEDDIPELAALAGRTFPLACPPHTTDEAKAQFVRTMLSEASFEGYLADADRDLLVAESDDGLVGYVMTVAGEPVDAEAAAAATRRPTVELSKCYADAAMHGSGAAGLLVDAAIELAVRRGARAMWLGVNEENARAHRFYGKHGFSKVGTKHFLVGDRLEDDWVMERPLP